MRGKGRLRSDGLLIVVGLVFFAPSFQIFLTSLLRDRVALLTSLFGIASDVELVLRSLLFG